MAKAKRKKIATMTHPVIEAVAHALFRYDDIEQAYAQMESIKKQFVISKEQPQEDDAAGPQLRLWIRGYDLTQDDKSKGYTGHFAILNIKQIEGRYAIAATKDTTPLAQHPQKRRPKQSHPDWGHPILRAIKRGKTFKTIEAADNELQALHRQFPNVSIPNPAKLHCIVYEKRKGEKGAPIRKYTFEVKPTAEGEFLIHYQENIRIKGPKAVKENVESSPEGYFTALVQTKRKKKKPVGNHDNNDT